MNDHGVYSVSTAYAQPVTDVEDAVMINPLADRPLHDEIETIGKALVGHWNTAQPASKRDQGAEAVLDENGGVTCSSPGQLWTPFAGQS